MQYRPLTHALFVGFHHHHHHVMRSSSRELFCIAQRGSGPSESRKRQAPLGAAPRSCSMLPREALPPLSHGGGEQHLEPCGAAPGSCFALRRKVPPLPSCGGGEQNSPMLSKHAHLLCDLEGVKVHFHKLIMVMQ